MLEPCFPIGALHDSDHLTLCRDQWSEHTFVSVGPEGLHRPRKCPTHSQDPKLDSAVQGSFAFQEMSPSMKTCPCLDNSVPDCRVFFEVAPYDTTKALKDLVRPIGAL